MLVYIQFVLAWFIGLFLAWFIPTNSPAWWVLIISFSLLLLVSILVFRYGPQQRLLFQILFWLMIGLCGFAHLSNNLPDVGFRPLNTYTGFGIVESTRSTSFTDQLVIQLVDWYPADPKWQPNVLLLIEQEHNDNVQSGDTLYFKGHIELMPASGSPGSFNARTFWAGKGVRYRCTSLDLLSTKRGKDAATWMPDRIQSLQTQIVDKIGQLDLDEANQGILKGMLLGDKSDLLSEQKAVFSVSGIMHLLAVSGLHVGMIYLILIRLFRIMRWNTHHPLVRSCCIIFVWIYVLICGIPPSAARAAGMVTLHSLAFGLARPLSSIHIVLLMVWIHSLFDPAAVFSVGFQLSYLAITGILFLFPRLQKLWKGAWWGFRKIGDLLGLSLSAQSLTLPVVIAVFGSFPTYFLLGNLFLMPLGLLIFYMAILLLLLRLIGLGLIPIESILNHIMNWWFSIAGWIGDLPGSRIVFSVYPIEWVAFYLIVIIHLILGRRIALRPAFSLLFYVLCWSCLSFFSHFWIQL